jgi:hypothetical protein
MSSANPPFAKNPLITIGSARIIAHMKTMFGYTDLFVRLETLLAEPFFSDSEQIDVNNWLLQNNHLDLQRLVDKKWAIRESGILLGKIGQCIVTIISWLGFVLCFLGAHFFIPMLPAVFGIVSRFFGASAWVVMVFSFFGMCLSAFLLKYVFKDVLMFFIDLGASVAGYIFRTLVFIWDTIAGCFLACLKFTCKTPTFDDCRTAVCDMSSALLGYGKNVTAAKFVSLAMTVLIALNATHEFVDADGNRFAIVPKDFANLPTPDAQRIRISRVEMPKPEMPLPNNSFEEKAEFLNEKSRQKVKSDEFTWASFGKWAMDVAMQHAVVQVIKYGAQRAYNWFFHAARDERSSLVRVFAGMGAGAIARNLVTVDAPLGNEVVGGVVGVVVYRMLEWVVSKAFDYFDSLTKDDRAKKSADAAASRQASANNVHGMQQAGNPASTSA